jgi:HK97 family phage portal protein
LGVIAGIFEGAMALRADVGGAPAPWDNFWFEPAGGHHSSSGMRVNSESAKRLSTVIACVSAKSRQLAMLPFKIYTDMPGGGKRLVDNHPLYDVLYSRPNEHQTAFEFKQLMQAHVELRGNAYAEKIPGPRGPIDQLVPMHPDRVKVEVLKGSGRLRYMYNDPLTGTTRALMQDEVFHLRDFSDVTAVGQSRIAMALDVIGLALGIQDYRSRFIRNDSRSGWVITGAKFKDKQDEDDFRENFRSATTGENRGKTPVMPSGMDIKALGVTPVDAQLLEGAKSSMMEVCAIFNVLPHLIGLDVGKAATFASTEQFNIMNVVQAVLPMAIMWEQGIQRDCLGTGSRYYAKASLASLLRGDQATRFAAYHTALGDGWMTQDEVRELEDMNPLPEGIGKNAWRPANWLPLKQLTAPPAPAKFGNSSQDDDEEDDDQSTETGSGGDSQAKIAQLKLLATSAADRCVRREVGGVRKLIERKAGTYEITEFYAEQVRFVVSVFHMNAGAELNVKIACDARAQHLSMLMADEDDEFYAGAQVWIENIAATEPLKLATLAVEGAR